MAGEDPLEFAFQVDRFMRRLNARVHAQAPEFDREKVGPIGGMILMTLAEVQPAPMQRIATMMGRDKAQLSRMFSSLERKGLVERAANTTDQRSSLLSLTPKGGELVDAIKHAVGGAVGDLLAPLDPQERSEMLRLLAKT
ncbi:MAG: MarR family transcriptional regulator [Erythrobacter sp.]|nr:MarR family transcriptional regulator [Erythrobacter sp.]